MLPRGLLRAAPAWRGTTARRRGSSLRARLGCTARAGLLRAADAPRAARARMQRRRRWHAHVARSAARTQRGALCAALGSTVRRRGSLSAASALPGTNARMHRARLWCAVPGAMQQRDRLNARSALLGAPVAKELDRRWRVRPGSTRLRARANVRTAWRGTTARRRASSLRAPLARSARGGTWRARSAPRGARVLIRLLRRCCAPRGRMRRRARLRA